MAGRSMGIVLEDVTLSELRYRVGRRTLCVQSVESRLGRRLRAEAVKLPGEALNTSSLQTLLLGGSVDRGDKSSVCDYREYLVGLELLQISVLGVRNRFAVAVLVGVLFAKA